VVMRPSADAGTAYPQVSRAYVDAVHAVLTHDKDAAEAAADLEVALRRVTGLAAPRRP
jgi:hypothetical protein